MFNPLASKRTYRGATVAVVAVAGIFVAAACGGSSSRTATSAGSLTRAAGAQPPPMAATPAASPSAIAAGTSAAGPIVVDATGRTLYRFDKDTAGSGVSACSGACATAWPPAVVTGMPTAGPGVAGALGVITRAEGTSQITLDGHPLYRFSGDQGPGDTTGDGFGGIWHIVRATGSAATATASPSPGY